MKAKILGLILLVFTPVIVVVGVAMILGYVTCQFVGEVYRAWVGIVEEIGLMFRGEE